MYVHDINIKYKTVLRNLQVKCFYIHNFIIEKKIYKRRILKYIVVFLFGIKIFHRTKTLFNYHII